MGLSSSESSSHAPNKESRRAGVTRTSGVIFGAWISVSLKVFSCREWIPVDVSVALETGRLSSFSPTAALVSSCTRGRARLVSTGGAARVGAPVLPSAVRGLVLAMDVDTSMWRGYSQELGRNEAMKILPSRSDCMNRSYALSTIEALGAASGRAGAAFIFANAFVRYSGPRAARRAKIFCSSISLYHAKCELIRRRSDNTSRTRTFIREPRSAGR